MQHLICGVSAAKQKIQRQVMYSDCLMVECLESFCLFHSRISAHQVAADPVSMMLLYMTIKSVASVDRVEMLRTDCSGETRLPLHIPDSS